MIQLGNNSYKLLFLDTNSIREMIGDKKIAKGFMTDYFLTNTGYVPCFSIYNIMELKPYKNLYLNFIDLFGKIPCILFYPYKAILQQEWGCYKNNKQLKVDCNIANAFSIMGIDASYDIDCFVSSIWKGKTEKLISESISGLQNVADVWEKQRLNNTDFSPNNDYYKKVERIWISNALKACDIPISDKDEIAKLPGARIMGYSQFCRVHNDGKKILKNDVMDVMISCIVPYVDAVITEGAQCEILKKSKNIISQMNGIELYNIKILLKQWRNNDKTEVLTND